MYACRAGGPIQGNLTWSVETCPINVMPREKTCKVFVPFLLAFFGKKDEEGKEETLGVRKGRDIFLAIFFAFWFFSSFFSTTGENQISASTLFYFTCLVSVIFIRLYPIEVVLYGRNA